MKIGSETTFIIKDGKGHFADGGTPQMWHRSAQSLAAAAAVLLGDIRADWNKVVEGDHTVLLKYGDPMVSNLQPAAMICAFALECLFKGLASARNMPPLHSHELMTLAARVEFPLTKEEADVCVVLTEFALYLGRYPVAKNLAHQQNGWGIGDVTFRTYEQLFERAARDLRFSFDGPA